MLDILKAVLFGIVQGITEWLPVSSTGHLILLDQIVKLNVSDNFYSVFEVVIQLGSIIAVLIIFWKKLWPFGKLNNKHPLTKDGIGSYIKWDKFILWFHIVVSCIPAILIGLPFDDLFEELFYNPTCVAIALIVVGIAFIIIENRHKGKTNYRVTKVSQITYKDALIIGAFQVIAAIFPGTSRSGATIIGALIIGVSRSCAAEYTFFLAVPAMLGASLLKILKLGLAFSLLEYVILLVGSLVAFVVSLFVIKGLMNYVKKHDFKIFGYYRIVLGIVVLVSGLFGLI